MTDEFGVPLIRVEMLGGLRLVANNEIDRLGRADVRLGRLFAQAVNELLARAKVPPAQVRAIGSHGQTIRHRPGGAALRKPLRRKPAGLCAASRASGRACRC